MELIQTGLLWAYILICFMVIWYGVALLLSIWQLLGSRRSTATVARDAFKFAAIWVVGWLVIVIGRLTTVG